MSSRHFLRLKWHKDCQCPVCTVLMTIREKHVHRKYMFSMSPVLEPLLYVVYEALARIFLIYSNDIDSLMVHVLHRNRSYLRGHAQNPRSGIADLGSYKQTSVLAECGTQLVPHKVQCHVFLYFPSRNRACFWHAHVQFSVIIVLGSSKTLS